MIRSVRTLVPLALLFSATACDSGGGGPSPVGASSSMAVLSCTLGCGGPNQGPLGCSVTSVFVNQDIWLEFNQPVQPGSVNKNTFRVVNALTGATPPGLYKVDPSNPRRVAFQPQLSFDSNGNPQFGLTTGQSYRVTVPGANSTSGPFIQNTAGQPNTTLLDCFVQATLGVNDPVPGAPTVTVLLDVLSGSQVVATQPAANAEDVPLNARLRLEFDDIMNPATLVNPATGEATFISVTVDLDGDLGDNTDQIELQGTYTISINDVAQTTTVTFTPTGGFPSSGSDSVTPRRIVVDLPTSIVDLGDNSLANAGLLAFTTESVVFPPALLPGGTGEDFTTAANIDLRRTGAILVHDAGRALPGWGGGAGRFGDFVVGAGQQVVLSTGAVGASFGPGVTPNPATGSKQTFVLDNYDTGLGEAPGEVDYTAADGIYEFSSLTVEPGGLLRFDGPAPARVFVRGEASIRGLVVLTGAQPSANPINLPAGQHDGSQVFGQPGGIARLGGGAGGAGGDRHNMTGTPFATVGGAAPGLGVVTDSVGKEGGGRGGVPGEGGGGGGFQWPSPYPGPALTDYVTDSFNLFCYSTQVGGPGGGGSFGGFGAPGNWIAPSGFGTPPGPPAAPGGADRLLASETTLDPEQGLLVGGAGGGGGGVGIAGTRLNSIGSAIPGGPICTAVLPGTLPPIQIFQFFDASGAGGGSGGGALQLQAGRRLFVDGTIDVRGGQGGGAMVPVTPLGLPNVDGKAMTAPGGGGSGGAVLLQSLEVALSSIGGVVDLRGGAGGSNPLSTANPPAQHNPSTGGTGGAGILRLESSPLAPLSVEIEAPKVLPSTGGAGEPLPEDLVATASFAPTTMGPGRQSGLQSCWLRPDGSPLEVDFLSDDYTDPLAPILGWNMTLALAGTPIEFPFRGPGLITYLTGQDLETMLGGELDGSPLVVRFQGARVVGALEQPCLVDPLDPNGPFLAGSLTPWVRHPAELNDYWTTVHPGDPGLAAKLKPNVIRYVVVFDRSQAFGDAFELVGFEIRVQPD